MPVRLKTIYDELKELLRSEAEPSRSERGFVLKKFPKAAIRWGGTGVIYLAAQEMESR